MMYIETTFGSGRLQSINVWRLWVWRVIYTSVLTFFPSHFGHCSLAIGHYQFWMDFFFFFCPDLGELFWDNNEPRIILLINLWTVSALILALKGLHKTCFKLLVHFSSLWKLSLPSTCIQAIHECDQKKNMFQIH